MKGVIQMRLNIETLKTLELKIAEYSKNNGTVAEHESMTNNCKDCTGTCTGTCQHHCKGSCDNTSYGAWYGHPHGKHK